MFNFGTKIKLIDLFKKKVDINHKMMKCLKISAFYMNYGIITAIILLN